jgi:hypothetical protein
MNVRQEMNRPIMRWGRARCASTRAASAMNQHENAMNEQRGGGISLAKIAKIAKVRNLNFRIPLTG